MSKELLDVYLYSLLGSKEFVDRWWESQNVHFNLRAPLDVYFDDPDGPEQVTSYVMQFCNGDYY